MNSTHPLAEGLARLVGPRADLPDLRPGDRLAVRTADSAHIVGATAATLVAGATAILVGPADSGIAETEGTTVVLDDSGCRRVAPPFETEACPGRVAIATGGSTGGPRFVLHDASTLAAAAQAFATGIGGGAVHAFAPLPAWHVGGLMPAVRAALTGGTWSAHADYRETGEMDLDVAVVSLVPTQLRRLLGDPEAVASLRRARLILLGGAATPQDLIEDCLARDLPIALSYGLTEAAATVAWLPNDELKAAPRRRDGRLLPGIAATLESLTDSRDEGRLVLAGPSIALGRMSHEGAFDAFPSAPGGGRLLRTSDRARMPDAGRVEILGRLDRLVNTGGEKVDPDAVASRVIAAGLAREAHAFGEPDPDWGERLVLAVAPKPANRAVFEASLRDLLTPPQRPKRLLAFDTLPRTALGKIDHARLADAARSP